jgi:hypothetical protein
MAGAAYLPVESAASPVVERIVLARAEILQVGLDLLSNRHWRRLECSDNGAALFRIEDAAALPLTVSRVGTQLQQDHLVLVVLDRNGYIAPAQKNDMGSDNFCA